MRLGCGLVIALLLVPASARARVPVLVEHHATRPSARSARLLATLATGLGSRVRQGSAVVTAARRGLGQRARPLSATRLSQLVSAVKAGAEHGYAGDWTRAVTTLQSARQGLMGDVLSLARQRTLLRALQRARLLLVMCYLRLKQPRRAWAMMEEGLRTQPDLSPSGALYGPELQRLYYRVKAQLDLQKARLRVTTDPPGALIFLNGRSIGFSPVTAAGLYPGTYDVLVVKGKQHSRIRRFKVASPRAHLRLDLGLDGAVRLGAQVGLRVSGGVRGRARALRYARALGIELGARKVLLVGVRRGDSGRVLHGRLVDCTRGVVLRAAFVSVTQHDPGADVLGGLGRYLLEGGVPGVGVHRAKISVPVRRARQGPDRPGTDPSGAGPRRGPASMTGFGVAGWILLGSGLITAGTGGVLWGIDGHTRLGAAREADRYDTDRAGAVVLGVGLGVAALGAALLIVDAVVRRWPRPSPRRTRLQPVLAPTRGGGALGLGGRF